MSNKENNNFEGEEWDGYYMIPGFLELNEVIGIDFQRQILCIDVGRGPELSALNELGAKKIFATEPGYDNRETIRRIQGSVKMILEKIGGIFLGGDYVMGILALKNQEEKVGLITRLNVYPDDINTALLPDMVERSKDILEPDGVIIVSVVEKGYGELLERHLPEIEGFSTGIVRPKNTTVGHTVLFAKKILEL